MKIFISYSHRDKNIAENFYHQLKDNGFDVFWDNNILTGSNWGNSIQDNIIDADVVVLIVTENSITSKTFLTEAMMAVGYNKIKTNPRLFPYVSRNVPIPDFLQSIMCIIGTDSILDDSNRLIIELNKLKGTLLAEKVEINLDAYTEDVFNKLKSKEKINRGIAYGCYIFSILSLISTAILAMNFININQNGSSLAEAIQIFGSKVLFLAILIAISRLAFILGKSFMVEAIRNADRTHAISFGEFFIKVYGDEVTHSEFREVFGEWNIDKGSSFHTQDPKDFDPNVLSTLEIVKDALRK